MRLLTYLVAGLSLLLLATPQAILAQTSSVPPKTAPYADQFEAAKTSTSIIESTGTVIGEHLGSEARSTRWGQEMLEGVAPAQAAMTSNQVDLHEEQLRATSSNAKRLGVAAGVVGTGVSAASAVSTCTNGTQGCGLAAGDAGMSVIGHVGKYGAGAAGAWDAGRASYKAYEACSDGKPDCALGTMDAIASTAGMFGAPGKAISGGWTIGRTIGDAINVGYRAAFDEDMGDTIARAILPSDDEIFREADERQRQKDADKAWASFERTAARIRADSNTRYQSSTTELRQEQADYDAQQAAQQQAAQPNSADFLSALNTMVNGFSPSLQTPTASAPPQSAALSGDAGGSGLSASCPPKTFNTADGCHPGHDEAAHPGGCHCG